MVSANITNHGYIISGHADYDEYGYDVVCAGISALSQTIALALNKHCKGVKVEATNGWITVDINEPNDVSDVLIDTLIIGLTNISTKYPEHLKMRVKRGMR